MISPWSKGGWVNSQVFDHTSLIRFIEQRFGRDVSGGLIGAEHHAVAPRRVRRPDLGLQLRDAPCRRPGAAQHRRLRAARSPPAPGLCPGAAGRPGAARTGGRAAPRTTLALRAPRGRRRRFRGRRIPIGLHQCRQGRRLVSGPLPEGADANAADDASGPWSYTVEAGKSLSATRSVAAGRDGAYDLSVHGPNGFLRSSKAASPGSIAPISPSKSATTSRTSASN